MYFDRTTHGVDDAGELESRSKPSPVLLTMRPRCSLTFGVGEFAPMHLQPGEGAFLVCPREPAVARHIRGENGGQPAFDASSAARWK